MQFQPAQQLSAQPRATEFPAAFHAHTLHIDFHPFWFRLGESRCEACARGTQPEIRWPLAGKRVAAPVGTASLLGREATERTRGDSLVSNGHDFDSRSAV